MKTNKFVIAGLMMLGAGNSMVCNATAFGEPTSCQPRTLTDTVFENVKPDLARSGDEDKPFRVDIMVGHAGEKIPYFLGPITDMKNYGGPGEYVLLNHDFIGVMTAEMAKTLVPHLAGGSACFADFYNFIKSSAEIRIASPQVYNWLLQQAETQEKARTARTETARLRRMGMTQRFKTITSEHGLMAAIKDALSFQ